MEREKYKSRNHWMKWDNVETVLRGLITKLGHFPSRQEFIDNNFLGLYSRLQRHYGGIYEVKKRLGVAQIRVKRDYWKDIDNCILEAEKAIEKEEWNELPNSNVLRQQGYYSLTSAINLYHGGFHKFRRILGENNKRNQNGLWRDLDFTINYAKKLMQEHGFDQLPASNKLNYLGYTNLITAVIRYHGGFHKFRELLGEQPLRVKAGSWQSLEFTLDQARKVMKELGVSELPSEESLERSGYNGLPQAIQKYHGGIKEFRRKLRETITGKTDAEQLEELLEKYAGDD